MNDPETLILIHMIKNSLPTRTIEFFQRSYQYLKNNSQASGRQLAEIYGFTPQAAGKHIHKLVAYNYLIRIHYRAWALNDEYISDILGESK